MSDRSLPTAAGTLALVNKASGSIASALLPYPTTSALGGVKAAAGATAHQWVSYIDTSGAQHFSQPSATDISGLAASATTDTTNAGNISSGTLAVARLPTPLWSDGTNAAIAQTLAITWGLTSEAIHTATLSVNGSLAANSSTGEHLFINSTSTPAADVCTVNVGLVLHTNSGGCSALRFGRYDYSATNNSEMGAVGYGNNGAWSGPASNYDGAMYLASSDLSGVAPWSSTTLIPVVIGQYGTIAAQSGTPNTFFNQIILDNVGAINFYGGPYNAAVNLLQIPQSGLVTIGPVTSSSTNVLNVVDSQTIASSGYQAKGYYNSGAGSGGIKYLRASVGASYLGVTKISGTTYGMVGTDQSWFSIRAGLGSTGDTSTGTQAAAFSASTAVLPGTLAIGVATATQVLDVAANSAAIAVWDDRTATSGAGGAMLMQHVDTSGNRVTYGKINAAAQNGSVGAGSGDVVIYGLSTGTLVEAARFRGSFNSGGHAELGFFGHATALQPTVTGAKGSNAALGSLMTALASMGLVVDSTTT